VCAEPGCVEKALKAGRLGHAFRAACRLDEGLELSVLSFGGLGAIAGSPAPTRR
jgi:hypothetical protein